MSRLIRYLTDLLYKQYILEHMPLSHTEIMHNLVVLHLRKIPNWLIS